MSFEGGKGLHIVGSASVRSQHYAGDFDGYQVVQLSESSDKKAAEKIAHEWRENIKRLRALSHVYIGDIKCGTIPDWRVIPATARLVEGKVVDYNPTQSRKALDMLLQKKVITPAEAKEAAALLKSPDDVASFLRAKQLLKFHVIRWTPEEILRGRKKVRDRVWVTLRDAILSPGMAKMDAIALLENNRFTDFSVIYEFHNKGKVLNPERYDVRESLRESIVAYKHEGNYFKTLKRIYALARHENDLQSVTELTPILNSDLGRLYHIISDIRTLVQLLQRKRVPLKEIRTEIDQFIGRLSGIYSMSDYLKGEKEILGRLSSILKMAKGPMSQALDKLATQLDGYLQYATKHTMKIPTGLTGGVTVGQVTRTLGTAAAGAILPVVAAGVAGGSLTALAITGAVGALAGAAIGAYREYNSLPGEESATAAAPTEPSQRRSGRPPVGIINPDGSIAIGEPIEEEGEAIPAGPRPGGAAAQDSLMPRPMSVTPSGARQSRVSNIMRTTASHPQPEEHTSVVVNPLHRGRGKKSLRRIADF